MRYQVKIPSSIYGGEGCIKNVKGIIEKEQAKKILVFTDKGILATGLIRLLLDEIETAGAEYDIFDNLVPEPGYQDVENLVNETAHYDGNLIIAIGGGSVMDAAKLCSVLKDADYSIKDLLKEPGRAEKKIRTVM